MRCAGATCLGVSRWHSESTLGMFDRVTAQWQRRIFDFRAGLSSESLRFPLPNQEEKTLAAPHFQALDGHSTGSAASSQRNSRARLHPRVPLCLGDVAVAAPSTSRFLQRCVPHPTARQERPSKGCRFLAGRGWLVLPLNTALECQAFAPFLLQRGSEQQGAARPLVVGIKAVSLSNFSPVEWARAFCACSSRKGLFAESGQTGSAPDPFRFHAGIAKVDKWQAWPCVGSRGRTSILKPSPAAWALQRKVLQTFARPLNSTLGSQGAHVGRQRREASATRAVVVRRCPALTFSQLCPANWAVQSCLLLTHSGAWPSTVALAFQTLLVKICCVDSHARAISAWTAVSQRREASFPFSIPAFWTLACPCT